MQYIHIICHQKHLDYFRESGAFASFKGISVGQSLGFGDALRGGGIHPGSDIIVACVNSSSLRDLSGLVIKSVAEESRPSDKELGASAASEHLSEASDVANKLTRRQLDVLRLIQAGQPNKQIARDLGLCEGTVKIHCLAIFRILGVHNRTQAAMLANESMI